MPLLHIRPIIHLILRPIFFLSLIFGVSFFFFSGVTWHCPRPHHPYRLPPPPHFSLMSSRSAVSKSTTAKRNGKQASRPGRKRATPVHVSDDDEAAPAKGVQRVHWNNDRTDHLIEWLEENPEDRQRLFGDAAQDARQENRAQRVAKGAKSEFHAKIALYVFSVDPDERIRTDLAKDPTKYAKAVENRISV
jgi:hypothetical protein